MKINEVLDDQDTNKEKETIFFFRVIVNTHENWLFGLANKKKIESLYVEHTLI